MNATHVIGLARPNLAVSNEHFGSASNLSPKTPYSYDGVGIRVIITNSPEQYHIENPRNLHIRKEPDSSTNGVVLFFGVREERRVGTSNKIDNEKNSHLIRQVANFRYKESNWDGYNSEAPPEQTIDDAILLIQKLPTQALPSRVGLSNDGEISLIWDKPGLYADFGVTGDGSYTYFIRCGRRKLYGDDLPLNSHIPSEALDLLGSKCG